MSWVQLILEHCSWTVVNNISYVMGRHKRNADTFWDSKEKNTEYKEVSLLFHQDLTIVEGWSWFHTFRDSVNTYYIILLGFAEIEGAMYVPTINMRKHCRHNHKMIWLKIVLKLFTTYSYCKWHNKSTGSRTNRCLLSIINTPCRVWCLYVSSNTSCRHHRRNDYLVRVWWNMPGREGKSR